MLGKTVRMNLMVMENLFYGRRFSRVGHLFLSIDRWATLSHHLIDLRPQRIYA